MGTRQRPDARDIALRLADHIEQLAAELLGEPSQRDKLGWRFGRKGSLALVVAGERRGHWYSHEEQRGGDALHLIQYARCCTLAEAIGYGAAWLGGDMANCWFGPTVSRPAAEPEDPLLNVELAGMIWRECLDASGTIVETYLRNRGVELPTRHHEVLRFHPRCPFGKGNREPCMVAVFTDILTAHSVGIHRTALLADGSDRNRALGKKMLGTSDSAVIRLSPNDTVTDGLGLSEGIEKGLALLGLGWAPIWCAPSAGAIRAFPVLAGVEALTIFSDNDQPKENGKQPGQDAARICAQRWRDAGREVVVRTPRAVKDWDEAERPA